MRSRRTTKKTVAVAALITKIIITPSMNQTTTTAPFNYKHLNKIQKRIISNALSYTLTPSNNKNNNPNGLPNTPPNGFTNANSTSSSVNYIPQSSNNYSTQLKSNIKINQNYLNLSNSNLQNQTQTNNKTSIAQNKFHPNHLVASDNDYVRNNKTCGATYSNNSKQS